MSLMCIFSAPLPFRRKAYFTLLLLRRAQHVLNEYAVAAYRGVRHHAHHSANELAVLNNGRAAQVCG